MILVDIAEYLRDSLFDLFWVLLFFLDNLRLSRAIKGSGKVLLNRFKLIGLLMRDLKGDFSIKLGWLLKIFVKVLGLSDGFGEACENNPWSFLED